MSKSKITSGSSIHNLPESSSSRSKLYQNGSAHSFNISASSSSTKTLNALNQLHAMDPDEIFAKYTVHEVKSMLYRLRADVDAKQEELRLMVGERYRDLLQTSTSIISMSESADRVHENIERMHELVSKDLKLQGKRSSVSKKTKDNEDTRLHVFQSLAAHLKLLLDCPEHLWRLLESGRCLHAAWLFLLARVVHRSLVQEDDDDSQSWLSHGIHVVEHFPLVQRQWETVAQFRTQISHKATLLLRERALTSQGLCSSLLSLHLLDSLPFSDALDVFLKQRTRALQILYESLKASWSSSSSSSPSKGTAHIWAALHSILDVIVSTVGRARHGFELDGDQSLITRVLASIQSSSAPCVEKSSDELNVSTPTVLSSLPNANLFLSLPPDIKNFRPFVDLDSRTTTIQKELLDSKLRTWFHIAVEHLKDVATSWLQHTSTIKDVWEVRASSLRWIEQSKDSLTAEDLEELQELITFLSTSRAKEIWQVALEKLTSAFEATAGSLVASVADQADGSEYDVRPSEFLLSAPPAPSLTSSFNLSLMQSAFQRFKHGIEQRIEGMTPYLDKIMSELDVLSSALSDDINVTIPNDGKRRQTLDKDLVEHAEVACDRIYELVQGVIEDVAGRPDAVVRRALFGARIAHELALHPLSGHLQCSAAYSDRFRKRARNLHDVGLKKCTQFVVLSARDQFLSSVEELPSPMVIQAPPMPSSPSSRLLKSLLFIADSIQNFGVFDDPSRRSTIVDDTLTEFVRVLAPAMRERKETMDRQALWDLRFLRAVCEDRELGELALELATLTTDLQKDTEDDAETDLQSSVFRSLSQMRLLLSPLVSPTDPMEPAPENKAKKPKSTIPDVTEVDREMHNMMNLVKPSARFGMLWVGGQGT